MLVYAHPIVRLCATEGMSWQTECLCMYAPPWEQWARLGARQAILQ